MPSQSSQSLLSLDVYLKQFSQVRILQHFLGHRLPFAPAALDDVVFVGLDTEWYERGTKDITELGFSILDTLQLPPDAARSSWNVLKYMRVYHARIKENAHMVNTKLCPGRPDMFHFGETRFVSFDEARDLLLQTFTYQKANGNGNRPIIFVGHSVSNDVQMMKDQFDVDLNALGVIVATIDTQVLAQEVNVRRDEKPDALISLRDLLGVFMIFEEFLHTAGNDVAFTQIAAFLMASPTLMTDWLDIVPNQTRSEMLKEHVRTASNATFGISTFCTRCDSTAHLAEQCNTHVHCNKCAQSTIHSRHAQTHKTEKCGVAEVVVPCEYCTISTDRKRWTKATTHITEHCRFANGYFPPSSGAVVNPPSSWYG